VTDQSSVPPRPHWVSACLHLQVLAAIVYGLGATGALAAVGIGWRPGSWNDLFLVLFLGAPVLAARAAGTDRLAWGLIAAGWTAYSAGWFVWQTWFVELEAPPFPSAADALWVALYPCVWVAIVVLLRDRLPSMPRPMWLDGAVAALAAGAFGVALVVPAVTSDLGGSVAQNITLLVYPVGDLSVLSLLAGGLVVFGGRGCRLLWLLALAFSALLISDVSYLLTSAEGTWAQGGALDIGWALLAVVLARLAWLRRPGLVAPVETRRAAAGVVPTVFAGAAAGLLVCAAFVDVAPVAVTLAVIALVVFGVRGMFAMREAAELHRVRARTLTDDLTGLASRRALRDAVEGLSLEQPGEGRGWAVALLDLDGFKEINETLGHEAGDTLISEVGRRLAGGADEDTTVARVGGDEFAILARGLESGAAGLAARLHRAIEQPVPVDGLVVQLRGSVGIAFSDDVTGSEELFRRAEVAMYRSKSDRTGWSVYESASDQQGREQMELVSELRQALSADTGEVVAWYQPQIEMESGRLVAAEALARWEHPARGLLGPHQFIPLAERHGLMKQLTRHMIDQALADCARWSAAGMTMTVSVNVSAVNLVDADLVADVARALGRHGLAPQSLTLEVTEGDVMSDFERSARTLEDLRHLGVGLSIDDFGTGYSSLARLRALPVDEIKIDRSFVMSMTSDRQDQAIVSAVVDLARRFGKRIVAEGIEDEETWTELRGLGCDLAQGFLIGRPQRFDALMASAAGGFGALAEGPAPQATAERLAAKLAIAPTAKAACGVVVRYLAARGFALPSAYLRRGRRLRCQASVGYWQVLDGFPLGTGVIGQCLEENRTLNLDLGSGTPHYLEAASDVGYELAVPVRSHDVAVAVINVEGTEPFGPADVAELEAAAAALGARLEALGPGSSESPSQQLGRLVERFADATTTAEVKEHLAAAAGELTGMESAFVTVGGSGGWTRHAVGSLAETFSALTPQQVAALTEHVSHGASLIAAGDSEGEGLAVLDDLRRGGATTLVLIALRHLGHNEGLLIVADRRPEAPATERIELLELLAAQATSTLQTLATVERLREEASRDPLTGLGHRGAFHSALTEEIAGGDDGRVLAIALIDLDSFKEVNDTQGHLAGDRVLRTVAGQLTGCVRREDGIYRLGGDEFAAVLRDAAGLDLQETAERLRATIGATGEVTASVGVTTWRAGESLDALLTRADEALYVAKDAGRDAVCVA
jgi:diguanylate cyclase (GGDEF)-like protein